MTWNGCLAFLLSLVSLLSATDFKAEQIYAERGSHTVITLPLEYETSYDITWYKADSGSNNTNLYFSGTRLCHKDTYFGSYLHYTCLKNKFYLYSISDNYAGLYNAKATNNVTVTNFYYNLTVIEPIRTPNCFVSSEYLTKDYCIIFVNCTQNRLRTTVIYNNSKSDWVLNIKSVPNMSSQVKLQVTYQTFTKEFSYYYPFNELCQTIESQTDFNHYFDFIALAVIIVCSCFIIAASVYLYLQRKTLLSLFSCGYKKEKIKLSTIY
ncbi:E3 CR1-beta [Simian adenovirus 20]|uniref:E3 CR1-beta n=1 Tax=Simian adenovirus 20 TaxID=585059 RepID=F6KSV6_9ADEN|nr:E3 CR1-beta [Simian adenovirus 20]AEF59061.1 E3 CR1-beta [Simian adenovirus 20]